MRIGIVGHFGGNENFTDGQTVKIKSLYNALGKYAPGIKIDIADTYYRKHDKIKLLFSFAYILLVDKKIIFFPASRGRRIFFKLFYYVSKIVHKEIYHDCIAGSLDKEITEHPDWIKYLNEFKDNWMESPQQVEKLQKLGVKNVTYIPNFKNISPLSLEELDAVSYSKPYQFCIFSRIEPMKGIEDALEAIKIVNSKEKGSAFLNIYGPIQSGFEDWFKDVSVKYAEYFKYCGVADPSESVSALKNQFALLFPTRYYTEGMPGTIIDAMFAGVPVIARKWAWCDNMLTNGHNGIVYEFDKPERLEPILEDVVKNPEKIVSLKRNCISESDKYSENKVTSNIKNIIGI